MAVVLLVLVLLGYLQFRTLSSFRWSVLENVFDSILWSRIGLAVACIYGAYVTRAFRWSIFLRPTKPAKPVALIPAQFIGFTAIAVLGRLGEFVRPYLIARRQQISFTSQLAVYIVERIFDLLAAATIIAVTLSISSSVSMLPHSQDIRRAGYLAMLAAVLLGGVIIAVRISGTRVAAIFGRVFGWFSKAIGHFAQEKIQTFSHGLDTINGISDLLLALFWSFATWGLIALAYVEVVHAFRVPALASVAPAQTIILMAASMFGSVLQLPVVGGGSQLATIQAMISILGVGPEAATACGITLFVATFLTVIPGGLIFARMEQVSLRKVAASSEMAEESLENAV
ncbi:MAG TPA: lysylphosphatidylglycerol synthase transmembrane domain-containing protein [Acidobacteriaceae bacterium]|nr:lysylphosphatidylglycerol synthase transmembrane domain-containing protein [Acidobacteriaceae bacterium]